MNYQKMKRIKGGHGGCLTCGYQYDILPLKAIISVGFGEATVTKNGEKVYDENNCEDTSDFWDCQRAEDEAQKDPDNDWRIHLVAPLSERHYQRQGENEWVLYEKGVGFA